MSKTQEKERNVELYNAILTLQTVDECIKFFKDLCTVPELIAMEQRFQVAKCLKEGKIYTEIMELTGASSATISRVNRSLMYGTDGGYEIVFDRLNIDDIDGE